MSKRVRYSSGYIGVASDAAAKVLEDKGAAKIIPGEPKPPKKPQGKSEGKDEE